MANRKRQSPHEADALRRLRPMLLAEGAKVRSARRRRGWTQRQLGRRTDLSQQTISRIERGDGATLSLVAWQRVAAALDLPLRLQLGRDALEQTTDAGHLGMQELLLRLGRRSGRGRTFELATKTTAPGGWVDVGLVDHRQRCLILIECCNVMGDIGASARSSDRKRAEAEGLAIALGQGEPYSVHVCWVVRDTRRNRELLARYPELFASRFPGSSRRWVQALTVGGEPPAQRGLVWCDLRATRLFAWRRRAGDR